MPDIWWIGGGIALMWIKAALEHFKQARQQMEDCMKSRTSTFAALVLLLSAPVTLAEGDAERGAKQFNKCMACHSIKDAANKTGPHLVGIVGRSVAGVAGYKYSPAMLEFAKSNASWDEATLDTYLANPKDVVPKSKMAFPGMKKSEERADLIAYLKSVAP
jgi:cytochrome c